MCCKRIAYYVASLRPNISEIKSQTIIVCQQRGIRKVVKYLDSGLFDTLQIDTVLLGAEMDPHNLQSDA